MFSLKNIINIMKSRLNFFKVNKIDFYLNFFEIITINSFLNFFKITEFCRLIKSARFLIKFVKTEFELSDSLIIKDKEFLKNILESLK